MFSKIFGNYLVEQGYISEEQFADVNEKLKSVRVKLGLIAVAEGMMTEAQANSVNRIQAMEDKRFGDIAVEKGYLTEVQVGELLKKQGNSYIQFVQVLVDEKVLTLEMINEYLIEYRDAKGYSNLDMEMLKSGDTNKEILVFVNTGDELVDRHLRLAVRNVIRFVSADVNVMSVKKMNSVMASKLGYQELDGDFKAMLAFGFDDDAIITIANGYAKENFEEISEDVYDAVCEFSNCINGLFASELSEEDIEIDMLPPSYREEAKLGSDNMYVMELDINGICVQVVSVMRSDIIME